MLIPEIQRVVCAAIQLASGHIVLGARHFDGVMVQQLDAADLFEPFAAQGFIDQWGNFLTRQEAYTIAERQGQFKGEGSPHTVGFLYSEDLY